MCGIILSASKTPTLENVIKVKKQYIHQESRGQDGYGFVAVQNGEVKFVRSVYVEEIMEELDKLKETTLVMFHHRIPTCNLNTPDANHPIFITSKKNLDHKYFIVHNGSVQNSKSLRGEHESEGFKYKTEVGFVYGGSSYVSREHTDSESLGVEMAKFIEDKQTRIKARGGVAMFMLQLDAHNRPLNVYYFRNHNPIKWFSNNTSLFLASESRGSVLPNDTLYKLDLATWESYEKPARLSYETEVGTASIGDPIPWIRVARKPKIIDVKKNLILAPNTVSSLETLHEIETTTDMREHNLLNGKVVGNTLLVDGPKMPQLLGFNRLREWKIPTPLNRSLRTIETIGKEIEKAQEIAWACQSDAMSYIDSYGTFQTPVYKKLCEDLKAANEIVTELQEELSLAENANPHATKAIMA